MNKSFKNDPSLLLMQRVSKSVTKVSLNEGNSNIFLFLRFSCILLGSPRRHAFQRQRAASETLDYGEETLQGEVSDFLLRKPTAQPQKEPPRRLSAGSLDATARAPPALNRYGYVTSCQNILKLEQGCPILLLKGQYPIKQGSPNSVTEGRCPTCLNTPAWKFLVCLVRPWLAGSGVFN